jgi:arginine-tRNA-protein transferase
MAYKTSFQPLERLGRDGWRRMDEMPGDLPLETPLTLPARRLAKRQTVEA